MSSNAQYDAAMNKTTIGPDGRPYEADAMRDEHRQLLPFWQRLAFGIITIAILTIIGIGGHWLIFDLAPKLFNADSGTSQINFELDPGQWDTTEDHAPQQQTPTIPDPAPSMDQQTPTQSGPSAEIIIPFGALPRLIEIDPPTQKGEHMNRLEPLFW